MNVEIVSLNPFRVSFNLYNLLGEIDGHPKILFDMATGEYTLNHDKGFANLVSVLDHPLKGQPLTLPPDSQMWSIVHKQVAKRISRTGFNDLWATKAFNRYYTGDLKYPSYYFTMWDRDEDGNVSYHYIRDAEYTALSSNSNTNQGY